MDAATCIASFKSLAGTRSAADAMRAVPLSVDRRRWLAANSREEPVFVVECPLDGEVPPGLVLSNVSFQPWSECSIQFGDETRLTRASLIQCTSSDPEIQEFFIRSVLVIIDNDEYSRTVNSLSAAMQTLVRLFWALARPGTKSVQGLWAELWLLEQSVELEQTISAWHVEPRSLFDFRSGTQIVEVKSSLTPGRRHRFKLAQLIAPAGSDLLIASIIMRREDTGETVKELWARLDERLSSLPLLRTRVAAVIAEALGFELPGMSDARFRVLDIEDGVAIFNARNIPKVGIDASPAISDVEFTVDMNSSERMQIDEVCRQGRLFRALFGHFAEH